MALTERTPSGIIYVDSNGVSHNVKAVYKGSKKVRPEGGGGGWTPGEHTVAYYPLRSDIADYSGNGNDLTGGTGTYYNNMITTATTLTKRYGINVGSSDFTLSARIDYDKCQSTAGTSGISLGCNSDGPIWGFWGPRSNTQRWVGGVKIGSWIVPYTADMVNAGVRCLHLVREGSSLMLYIDGVLMGTATCSGSIGQGSYVRIGGLTGGNEVITCGNVILEDVAWSAQEISDYYNLTKGDYITPETYTPLEYIETTATSASNGQILQTGINLSSNYVQFDFKFRPLALRGSANYFFASDRANLTYEYYNGYQLFNIASSGSLFKTSMSSDTDYTMNMKLENGTMTLNNSSVSYSGSVSGHQNICFSGYYSGSAQVCSKTRRYYIKIYTGSSFDLVRNYVPMKRNSDSVAGMYDLVNDVFYPSAVNGNFVAGPEL